jgi:hypothetical protein
MKEESRYKKYIKNHIENVKQVWVSIQKHLINEFWIDDFMFHKITALIGRHDESKYSVEEFEGYRQYFFPINEKEKNKNQFNYSWNHHQKNNPHHWQYWIMHEKGKLMALEMPFEYIIEMLCDWAAMSLNFNDKPFSFYNKEKENMLLAKNTIICIESWISIFNKIVEGLCTK